jgi:ketosteroid isomerase-like protein
MEFREAVEAHDVDRMIDLLDEEVVFRSPVVYKPYRGRDEVAVLIRAAARVFEGHHYVRVIGGEDASR